jgi:excinuclease ABC subunit A
LIFISLLDNPNMQVVEDLSPQQYIIIKGARLHNLKNIDVALPRHRLIVVTGVSGSGKSSLTIDTLYAEGQRRYVESLSAYARQFLGRMNKPDIDYIKGISPAIAIEQKVVTRSARSTVGTLTEIYDYLRLLFARIGQTYSPISGQVVSKHEVADVNDYISTLSPNTRFQLLMPFRPHYHTDLRRELDILLQKGFTRLQINGKLTEIEEIDADDMQQITAYVQQINNTTAQTDPKSHNPISHITPSNIAVRVLIDRLVVNDQDPDFANRCADSINTAFYESGGDCIVQIIGSENNSETHFSNRFEADGISFEIPSPHLFNFNNPYGACKRCEGFGMVVDIDPNLVIPNRQLSVYQEAIMAWRGEKMSAWRDALVRNAHKFDFPIHRPIDELSPAEYELLWTGNDYFGGLNDFFVHIEEQTQKIQYRVMLSKYRGRTVCRECKGTRLRKDAQYVKINGKHIGELVQMPLSELRDFFQHVQLNAYEQTVAGRAIIEINNRLNVMCGIGLEYLNLNRLSATLSGGETQRINLTRSLGSNLTNSMYILDEPSVGLHPRDTARLVAVLLQLRNLGNTVIVVEHEEEVMKAADFLLDIGPLAGQHGGEVVFADTPDQLPHSERSLTAQYLTGKKQIAIPQHRRKPTSFIKIENATHHNLKNISVRFPLQAITVVSGVSGSGKTSLVKDILYPALWRNFENVGDAPGKHAALTGDIKKISKVEMIDQNPLGKSSRSNPVTYIKAYDSIRDLYASQQLSKMRGFEPKHFSFNVEGGRCENCQGEGETVVEMQFLADVRLVCEDCNGKRFKQEVLDVTYNEKTIFDILSLSVDEAIEFFAPNNKEIANRLQPLSDVGLGYIKLGQSTGTLSGGEAQRVKLASYLGKGKSQTPILFIFDEPSTGLHFNDINKLLTSFNALVETGHTVVVVEHNIDIIKCADWLIDLGPEGGNGGGELLYEGAPEGLIHIANSYTAPYLAAKLNN